MIRSVTTNSTMRETTRPRTAAGASRRPLTNFFLIFNLTAILCWAVPLNSLARVAINVVFSDYLHFTGLWQSWAMFAPSPIVRNVYLEAEVTFHDGQKRVWSFYRGERVPLWQLPFKERFRQWSNDRVRLDNNSEIWPDAARYIARNCNDAPQNPPQTVSLIRYWSDIHIPARSSTEQQLDAPASWNHYVFYKYTVEPGDLR